MEENSERNEAWRGSPNTVSGAIVIAAVIIGVSWVIRPASGTDTAMPAQTQVAQAAMTDGGHILPLATENRLLVRLVENGAVDPAKLPQVTELNLLWAFGLANKNRMLEAGPIADLQYGGPANMASVGGWTVSHGPVMDHYDKHPLVTLTAAEQALVEKIAKGIYRPCCDNSTYFPDCNHGMAMLGLLEYLASQGATETELWNAAITANMRWFPDQYQTIAQYLKIKGVDTKNVTPQMLLGAEYSSGSSFARIAARVPQTQQQRGEGGCGVNAGQPANVPKPQSGCGV